jgi:hypothetical protein
MRKQTIIKSMVEKATNMSNLLVSLGMSSMSNDKNDYWSKNARDLMNKHY